MNPAFRRVRRGLFLLAALMAAAALGHWNLAGTSLLDSIYWAVITVGTVGFGERPNPIVQTPEKLLTITVVLAGTFTLAYTAAVLVQAVVQGQLQQALGERRMTREIAKLQDHVVLCGFGRTGQHLADRLAKQEIDFVVIDNSVEAVADARQLEYLALHGDATEEETLTAAGIERARTLVAALHGDAENVFLTLTARNMNRKLTILARGDQLSTEKKLSQAGADQVIMPAVIGAQQLADLIIKPHAAKLMHSVGRQATQSMDADMEELHIPAGSELVGKTIRDAAMRQKHEVMIVSVRRADGKMTFNPGADLQFQAGDTLVVIGETAHVREFRKTFHVTAGGTK